MTDAIRLQPCTLKPHNTVALPGSKSISNRTLQRDRKSVV